MEQNYRLTTKDLNKEESMHKYKLLLQEKWGNNVYYSVEHLLHFEKDSDKIKYFLFEKNDEPIILMPFIFREIKIKNKKCPYFESWRSCFRNVT